MKFAKKCQNLARIKDDPVLSTINTYDLKCLVKFTPVPESSRNKQNNNRH